MPRLGSLDREQLKPVELWILREQGFEIPIPCAVATFVRSVQYDRTNARRDFRGPYGCVEIRDGVFLGVRIPVEEQVVESAYPVDREACRILKPCIGLVRLDNPLAQRFDLLVNRCHRWMISARPN
jgi:hypothetical protein